MTKIIATAALLLLPLTACESSKSGAEISALGESLTSTAATDTTTTVATGPAIDYNPHTAANYANAVNTCQTESRSLCTLEKYQDAYSKGLVAWTVANPGYYWMVQTTQAPGANGANRNVAQYAAGALPVSYINITATLLRSFYCCL
jgi:hypothetical protein